MPLLTYEKGKSTRRSTTKNPKKH
jgi:hypothetical protein